MDIGKDLPRDEAWLLKLTETVRQNMSDENFGVTELSDALAISRYQLHRRLKALKGQSVSQCIRSIRLEEARKMLEGDVATSAEIAYRVGFGSPSYFNKCFHDHYGYPPGEVRKRTPDGTTHETPAPVSRSNDPLPSAMASKKRSSRRAIIRLPLAFSVFVAVVLAGFYWLSPLKSRDVAIAILPLDNLTGSEEYAYFVDGVHDALIGELGKVSALRVISRTSTLRYPKSNMLLPDIASELDVNVIIEGSVYGTGDSVRIQLQMIEVEPRERHVWAKEYHEDIRKALAVHSTVVRDIAKEIRVSLTEEEELRLHNTRAVNPVSYRAYLRGMFHLNHTTSRNVDKGIEYLLEAINADPGDPLPWAGLAIGYSTLGHGPSPMPDAFLRAKAAARKALALDSTMAEAHLALAMIALYNDWDWDVAGEEFSRALKYNPNLAEAHTHYAWFKMLFGHTEEVLYHGKKATELEPFSSLYSAYLATEYWWLGRKELASNEAGNALKLSPESEYALYVQGGLLTSSGMPGEGIKFHRKAVTINPQWKWALGHSYFMARQAEEAVKIIEELSSAPRPMDAWGLAEIYAAMGDFDNAFYWLDEGYRLRFSWVPWIAWNPNYQTLRKDPRFEELLERLNLPSHEKKFSER